MKFRQDSALPAYRVEVVVAEHGERHPLVVNRSSGLPLFNPCVWLTASRRVKGFAAGTLGNNAQTVASVYSWAVARGLDLDERFRVGEFLAPWEIGDLTDYLRMEVKTKPKHPNVQKLRSMEPAREPHLATVVTPGVGNYRLDIAASYLDWLATQTVHQLFNSKRKDDAREAETRRDGMTAKLRGRKQLQSNRNQLEVRMAPEATVIQRLLEVVNVDHPGNPWADPPRLVAALKAAELAGDQKKVKRLQAMLSGKLAIRMRNRLVIHLLFHLGLRRGEMLGLKVRDLKGHSLYILRHPDDPEDPRGAYAPNTKTRDRKLPVNPGLQRQILDYVALVRGKYPAARKHPYLVVNHRDGGPLSFMGLAKMFGELRQVEGIPRNLTPHHLRHAWNEEFSRLADEQGLDPAREVQLRSELAGWNPGTKNPTAMVYTRRHSKAKAQKISLDLQERMMHPTGDDNG